MIMVSEHALIRSMNHVLILLILIKCEISMITRKYSPTFFCMYFCCPAVLMKYLRILALMRDADQRTNCHLNIAFIHINSVNIIKKKIDLYTVVYTIKYGPVTFIL